MLKNKSKLRLAIIISKDKINFGEIFLIKRLSNITLREIKIYIDNEKNISKENRMFKIYKFIDRYLFSKISQIKNFFSLSNKKNFKYKNIKLLKKDIMQFDRVIDLRKNNLKDDINSKKVWKLYIPSSRELSHLIFTKNKEVISYIFFCDKNKKKLLIHNATQRLNIYSLHITKILIYMGWMNRIPDLIIKFKSNKIQNFNKLKIKKLKKIDNYFYFFLIIFIRLLFKAVNHIFVNDTWNIAFQKNNKKDIFSIKNDLSKMKVDNSSYFADPFIVKENNNLYCFFENYNIKKKKGVIQVGQITNDLKVKKIKTIINKKYHTSYPYIIKNKNCLWMIPETSRNNSVELYQCSKFPYKWKLKKKILKKLSVVDSSIIYYRNIYWLFTSKVDHCKNSDDFCIYWSKNLFGEWKPHKMNPIFTNVNYSRNAGSIIKHGNSIIRPAQSCLERYGEKINFFKIERLSKDEYKEKLFKSLDGQPLFKHGMHTWNLSKNISTFDYAEKRFKLF
jgi:hypothetical protein